MIRVYTHESRRILNFEPWTTKDILFKSFDDNDIRINLRMSIHWNSDTINEVCIEIMENNCIIFDKTWHHARKEDVEFVIGILDKEDYSIAKKICDMDYKDREIDAASERYYEISFREFFNSLKLNG